MVAVGGYRPASADAGGTNFLFLPLLTKDYDPLWQFQSPVKVVLQPLTLTTPFLIIDSSGRLHILWDTYSGDKTFIYHTYLTDQGWTDAAPVAQTLGRSKLLNPPVAGAQNDIHLVWYNELNLGGPYRILYAKWDGTQWGSEIELIGQGKSSSVNGMVRLDNNGMPHVAYIDSDGLFTTSIFYQFWTGTGFSPSQKINRPNYGSNIWLDTSGGICLYGDMYPDKVIYSYWKAGTFVDLERAITGQLSYRKGFLDGQNNYHLAKISSVPVPGGNVTGIYHQCLKNDLTWSPEVILSGEVGVNNTVLAFDEKMEYITAWSQNDRQTIVINFWNGCECLGKKELPLPPVEDSYGWGDLIQVAKSAQAGKICMLSKEKYMSSNFLLLCSQ